MKLRLHFSIVAFLTGFFCFASLGSVASASNITWNGTSSSKTWNTTTSNWLKTGTTSSTDFDYDDSVTFDDKAAYKTVSVGTGIFGGTLKPGAMTVNSSAVYTFTGNGLEGTTLTKEGTGNLVFSNSSNKFSGDVTISGGKLISSASSLTISGALKINSEGTVQLYLGKSNTGLASSTISGSGKLIFTNNGTSDLTYSSSTVSSALKGFTGMISLTENTSKACYAQDYVNAWNRSNLTVEIGAKSQVYAVTSGTYVFNMIAVGDTSTNTTDSVGGLRFVDGSIYSGNIFLDSDALFGVGALGNASATLSGVISGAGSLYLGANNTGYQGTNTVILTGSNTHAKTILGGSTGMTSKVVAQSDTALGDAVSFQNENSTLQVSADVAVKTLTDSTSGKSSKIEIDAGKSLSVTGKENSAFRGVISGSGSFNKSGVGSMTLTGSSSYTGTTTVSNGTLTAGGQNAFGTGNIKVIGGVLDVGNQILGNSSLMVKGGTLSNLDINMSSSLNGVVIDLTPTNEGASATLNNVKGNLLAGESGSLLKEGESLTVTGGSALVLNNVKFTLDANGNLCGNTASLFDLSDANSSLTLTGTLTFDVSSWGTLEDGTTCIIDFAKLADGLKLDVTDLTDIKIIQNGQELSFNWGESGYSDAGLAYAKNQLATTGKITFTIPEPSTATLSLLALAGLVARRRRQA